MVKRHKLRLKDDRPLPAHTGTSSRAEKPQVSSPFSTLDEIATAKLYALLDPDWFCNAILQAPNDPWQSQCMHAVADVWKHRNGLPTTINHKGLDKVTIRAMHGPGKTHYASKLMHWFNFVFQGRIVCTAPKQAQLLTRLWPEFHRVLGSAIGEYRIPIKYSASRIIWNDDPSWYAIAETASAPENLAGHHAPYMLFMVDEASGVAEEMFPVIEAAQSSGIITILVLIGNPTRTTGTFWASHNKREVSEQYFTYHIKLEDAPHVSRKWVDNQIKKYGLLSPVVRVRCFGEFADTEPDQLIALEWIENARARTFEEQGRYRMRLSVDVSDGGTDETVFTIAKIFEHCTHFIRQVRKSYDTGKATIDAANDAVTMWKDWGFIKERGDDIVVDAIGAGAGTAGRLMELEYPVIKYKGGESSDDSEQWRNRRVQSYLVMRNGLRDNWIHIDENFFLDKTDWDDFYGQMCAIKRKPGTEKVEDIETKQDLLKRIMKSPDLADSAAMVFATSQPNMGTKPVEQTMANAPAFVSKPLVGATIDFEGAAITGGAAKLEW